MNKVKKGHGFIYTFGVLTSLNKSEFELEHNSPIRDEHILGVQTRRRSETRLSINGNAIVNDGVFDSSFLQLKQRNTIVATIPLELIWKATDQGLFYPVNIPVIDMAQSSVLVTDPGDLVAGEEFEFTFKYFNEILQVP